MADNNKLSSVISGAISIFGQVASSPLPANNKPGSQTNDVSNNKVNEKTADDIPKEELMNLCMKMNKRMQLMENKITELSEARKTAINDRKQLLDLIKTAVTLPDDIDAKFDVKLISSLWFQASNKMFNKSSNEKLNTVANIDEVSDNCNELNNSEKGECENLSNEANENNSSKSTESLNKSENNVYFLI